MTTNWFEACATCENPQYCETMLYSVVCESRGMKAIYGMAETDIGPDQEIIAQAGGLVTVAALDAAGRLRQRDCSHDDLTIQQMITAGIDGGY